MIPLPSIAIYLLGLLNIVHFIQATKQSAPYFVSSRIGRIGTALAKNSSCKDIYLKNTHQ